MNRLQVWSLISRVLLLRWGKLSKTRQLPQLNGSTVSDATEKHTGRQMQNLRRINRVCILKTELAYLWKALWCVVWKHQIPLEPWLMRWLPHSQMNINRQTFAAPPIWPSSPANYTSPIMYNARTRPSDAPLCIKIVCLHFVVRHLIQTMNWEVDLNCWSIVENGHHTQLLFYSIRKPH